MRVFVARLNWGSARKSAMPASQLLATIASNGRITLPKPVRHALGVDSGGRVAFEIRGSQVVVTRAEVEAHADPAIRQFLGFLERDIAQGRRLSTLPPVLARSLTRALRRRVDLSAPIEGDVSAIDGRYCGSRTSIPR